MSIRAAGGASGSGDPGLPREAQQDRIASAIYRLVSASGLLLGVWVGWSALRMTYYTPVGPGPGFFPFWLGLLLALFCAALLADNFRNRPVATLGRFVPPRGPLAQIVTTLAAIAAFALFVQRLGFAITMLGVLLALLLVRGCRLFPTAILVALAGSFGVGLAFTHFLGVYLPPAHAGRHYFRFRDLMAHLSRENGVWRGATRQQIGRLLNGLGTEGADVGKTTKVLKGKQSEVRWVRDGLFAQAGTVPLPAGREDPI